MRVKHEITLIAFIRDDQGRLCIADIVETSYHYASVFYRRYRREPLIYSVAALSPGRPWTDAKTGRPIVR